MDQVENQVANGGAGQSRCGDKSAPDHRRRGHRSSDQGVRCTSRLHSHSEQSRDFIAHGS